MLLLLVLAAHAHAVITLASPCASALAPDLPDLVRPLLQSLTQRSSRSHGMRIDEFIGQALEERARIRKEVTRLVDEWPQPIHGRLRPKLLHFELSPEKLEAVENAIRDFGTERIPIDPRPMSGETLELWLPRYKAMRGLGASSRLIGLIGELVAISTLPEVRAANISYRGAISAWARQALDRHPASISKEDRDWFRNFTRQPSDIDVVFDEGASFAEIKFVNEESSELMRDHLLVQARRLRRYANMLEAIGCYLRLYFIFVRHLPSENLIRSLEAEGVEIIHIPY